MLDDNVRLSGDMFFQVRDEGLGLHVADTSRLSASNDRDGFALVICLRENGIGKDRYQEQSHGNEPR
jgi:hypothetical protein